MNAAILCAGALKEKWQKEGCQEYLKRLSRYGRYEVIEVPDEKEPEHASDAIRGQIVEKEGRALLAKVKPNDRVVALAIRAKAPDSEGLAGMVRQWEMDGRRVVFVIGASLGLSGEVLARADEAISFSNMTFPHPLMRVILLEQLYRAAKINAGERYHK